MRYTCLFSTLWDAALACGVIFGALLPSPCLLAILPPYLMIWEWYLG